MFALVNDVAAYPRRFDWCDGAKVLESSEGRMVARLDLGLGALRTWFTTENTMSEPHLGFEVQCQGDLARRLVQRVELPPP